MTHVVVCRCQCRGSDGVAGVAEDVEMCKAEDGSTVMATHSRIGASDGVGRLEVRRSGASRKCNELDLYCSPVVAKSAVMHRIV